MVWKLRGIHNLCEGTTGWWTGRTFLQISCTSTLLGGLGGTLDQFRVVLDPCHYQRRSVSSRCCLDVLDTDLSCFCWSWLKSNSLSKRADYFAEPSNLNLVKTSCVWVGLIAMIFIIWQLQYVLEAAGELPAFMSSLLVVVIFIIFVLGEVNLLPDMWKARTAFQAPKAESWASHFCFFAASCG